MDTFTLERPDYLGKIGDSDGSEDYLPGNFSAIPAQTVSFDTLREIFPDRDFNRFTFPLWVQLRDGWFRQSTPRTSATPTSNILTKPLSDLLLSHFQSVSPKQIVPDTEIHRLCQAFVNAGVYYDQNQGARPTPTPCTAVLFDA